MESQIRGKFAKIGTTDTCMKAKINQKFYQASFPPWWNFWSISALMQVFVVPICADLPRICDSIWPYHLNLKLGWMVIKMIPNIQLKMIPNIQFILISGSDGRVKWNRKSVVNLRFHLTLPSEPEIRIDCLLGIPFTKIFL